MYKCKILCCMFRTVWFFTYFVAYPLETEIATNQKDMILLVISLINSMQLATWIPFIMVYHDGMYVHNYAYVYMYLFTSLAKFQTIMIKSTITQLAMYIIYTVKSGL